MKHYYEPIIHFAIKCPKTGLALRALIKTVSIGNNERMPRLAECRGALYDEPTCQACIAYCTSLFFHEQEPDDLFNNPLVPQLDKRW